MKIVRHLLVVLVLAGGGLSAAGTVEAQGTNQVAVRAVQTESASAEAGLPLRDTRARMNRAYWHVFIAFAAAWILLFGFSVSMKRRLGRIERDLDRLQV